MVEDELVVGRAAGRGEDVARIASVSSEGRSHFDWVPAITPLRNVFFIFITWSFFLLVELLLPRTAQPEALRRA